MNLTNKRQEEDKQNINYQNICINGPGKKKIEKKSIVKRYTSGKTAEAIKRLTLDLKLSLTKQKSPCSVVYPVDNNNFSQTQTIELSGLNNKKCEFLCYNDESAVAQEVTSKSQLDINSCDQLGYRKLLKQHTTDHDIESDDQHLQLCVEYMKACLSDAGQSRTNRTNRTNQQSGVGLRRNYENDE